MKILHISDLHYNHQLFPLSRFDNVDLIIFTGDCSNPPNPYLNEREVRDFIEWYGSIKGTKIFIGGNHDTSIEKGLVKRKDFESKGIIYLENEDIRVEDIRIWGSPITPTFGVGWAWNRDRAKIHKVWDSIPEDTDIICTHGPPKGILDISFDRQNRMESCGCSNLRKRIDQIKPKAVLFGHIHNCADYTANAGILKLAGSDTLYSNGSCCTDGRMGELSSYGNIIEL